MEHRVVLRLPKHADGQHTLQRRDLACVAAAIFPKAVLLEYLCKYDEMQGAQGRKKVEIMKTSEKWAGAVFGDVTVNPWNQPSNLRHQARPGRKFQPAKQS